jgi:UDPglucose--hexose-1-phosphate uridylyltransferase
VNGFLTRSHRRYNPLTGDWVLVSPGRLSRPWSGEVTPPPPEIRPPYDPECYLCPGNVRANGERNPAYTDTYVFDNDYAALRADVPSGGTNTDGLFVARSEPGGCRVVCFSPRHDVDIAQMSVEQVRAVVDVWAQQYTELTADPLISAVTIFENRGAAMGASNPHPHGQIWANATVPNELAKEDGSLKRYAQEHDSCLLCAYADREIEMRERVIYSDARVCVVVPFWAFWPFETLIIPRMHAPSIAAIDAGTRDALANAMRDLTSRYDRLFSVRFPYSMGFHQQPVGTGSAYWHAHAHYYPPLLRSASVRKFMVGYELLAQPQRDIVAEEAAQRLRDA